jgi:NAD(P)-dependent dehydrogenase (short-subunit alcohol dehydrogenase family)
MTGRLDGRVAIVTGAASGIGRAVALKFASEGARVVVADLQEEPREALPGERTTVDEIRGAGGAARFVALDVTDTASVDAFYADLAGDEGRLDILVNNAGRFGNSSLLTTSDDQWDHDLKLNLTSQFLMCRRAVAIMRGQDGRDGVRGRIINVASQLGITAPPEAMTYGVAKAGVAHLTRQLAVDFARDGVIVNAVAPGRIITGTHPGERDYLESGAVDAATAFSLSRTPFPRLGRPEDVAGSVLFLASDDCTFVSGHILAVDGGWTAY